MNVFELRDQLVSDYSQFIRSFVRIRDERVGTHVEEKLAEGHLWPAPLIQLNPAFQPGSTVDDLVAEGVLEPTCARVFRRGKSTERPEGLPLRLHQHQEDAIRVARGGSDYVLTTGTGSGKSLAYIIPIVDHVLRAGSGTGVKAIIVYPMNALANSQFGELEKFLGSGFGGAGSPVRFERYTGQESTEDRDRIIANPPDIILTNYVMLELMLTRPEERELITSGEGLKYLVLDELHTYRGRQGADVAYLVRRVRDRMGGQDLQCVGTSATIAGAGSHDEQREEVAAVASKLFGTRVAPEHVIGETLRRSTPPIDAADAAFVALLRDRLRQGVGSTHTSFADYISDPLSSWLEDTVGIQEEGAGSTRLVRARPRALTGPEGLSRMLADRTGEPQDACEAVIADHLLTGYGIEGNPETGFPPFAFRLHQFVSRGDTVYATPEPEDVRAVTLEGRRFVPKDRTRGFLPLVFCRECGQDYYVVKRVHVPDEETDGSREALVPRELSDRGEEGEVAGFLYLRPSEPWPANDSEIVPRLPEDWVDGERVRPDRRDRLPQPVSVDGLGRLDPSGTPGNFLRAPFRFCLCCGVEYSHHARGDFPKLASLATEGRSTATTVMVLSAIRYLKGSELPAEARKLLSFTDNRQDASLQAGHLNDFIEVGLLRSATFRAAQAAGEDGIEYDRLTKAVFDALNLPFESYASNPEAMHAARRNTERALREVLGYRIYRDLQRGWRITLPNLEQCGLLEIRYPDLEAICADGSIWADTHGALATATPEVRHRVAKTLLDHLRRELALKVDYLDPERLEQIQGSSAVSLREPWALDRQEQLVHATVAFPRSRRKQDDASHVFLSSRGGFGGFLRRGTTFPDHDGRLRLEDAEAIIRTLMQALTRGGLLEAVHGGGRGDGDGDPVPGYQVVASAMTWCAGDGTRPFHDPIRVPRESKDGTQPNPFFSNFYRATAQEVLGLEAREHTAQVQYDEREKREAAFRKADLPILFCSPTMELGVDISELNVVSLRNVPPTPANYAQRSGRAGRSGQPALVFTYCSTFSAHDQYFFRRPEQMVQGAVAPPRLDLANEDLVRAHVQAIWLAETKQGLGTSLRSVIDIESDPPTLELLPQIRDALDNRAARDRARTRAREVVKSAMGDLDGSGWYTPTWIDDVLDRVPESFTLACERWRELYRAAREQYVRQSQIRVDHSRPERDRREAERLQSEASAQLELLTESKYALQSDFYTYRYFASEGFLPGYAFPRLPLSAFIPGKRGSKVADREFVSRPRFLAISEFGPRAFVYHEGARYQINRVILPVDDERDPTTARLKQCDTCGYIHPISDGDGLDLCTNCDSSLPLPLNNLLRLHNVSTRRRDRINADEEERTRYGYEIRTGVQFGKGGTRTAELAAPEGSVARIRYGHPMRLYRINMGWSRRPPTEAPGFVLDLERGYWGTNKMMEDHDPQDPMSGRVLRVIPFVEDWKNALLFEPSEAMGEAEMASLQAALKNAIQVTFQLEDQELSAEALPDRFNRRMLLFYEAAEGGAGVLRRVVEEPGALTRVARTALELCHFDPDSGEDRHRAPHAQEDCEAACYDCLKSYQNQMDHDRLDRALIRDFLLRIAKAPLKASPGARPRSTHLEDLRRQAGSDLERDWLALLERHGLTLPDEGQPRVDACATRPDFLYRRKQVAIYIDGPHHRYETRANRDRQQQSCLEDLGYQVIRFAHHDEWEAILGRFPSIFGSL